MERISNTIQCNIVPESMVGEIDTIFNYRRRCEMIVGPEVDYQYISPSVISFYFTDTESISNRYSIIDGNNIALPIQHKFNPNINLKLKKYLDQYRNSNNWYLEKGVYILTYYRVAFTSFNVLDNTRLNTNHAFNHLLSNHNVFKHYPNLRTQLTELLGVHYEKLNQYRGNKIFGEFTFRTLTYVKESEIINHGKVFVPGLNIVITDGAIEDDYRHPIDVNKVETKKPNLNQSTSVEYIILKNKPDVGERMYVKSGNDVIPIPVRAAEGLEQEGCYKFTNINGTSNGTKDFCSLEEMKTKFGIYNTIEECEYNGNKELVLEDMKFQQQKEKINLESKRLKYDYKKLKSDKESLKLNKETERLSQDLKLEMELIKYRTAKLGYKTKIKDEALDDINKLLTFVKTSISLIKLA